MVLDGSLMMSSLSAKQKEPYLEKVMALYERVAKSDDLLLANRAKYCWRPKLIERKQYAKAQEMLDLLPDWNALTNAGCRLMCGANRRNRKGGGTVGAQIDAERTRSPDHACPADTIGCAGGR
jgi:hypothetical protein